MNKIIKLAIAGAVALYVADEAQKRLIKADTTDTGKMGIKYGGAALGIFLADKFLGI